MKNVDTALDFSTLREAMKLNGVSMLQVADATEYTYTHVANIFKGGNAHNNTKFAIYEAALNAIEEVKQRSIEYNQRAQEAIRMAQAFNAVAAANHDDDYDAITDALRHRARQ